MNVISSQSGIGNNKQTIIENFGQIVFNLESKPKDIEKIMRNISGAKCDIQNNRLVLQGVYNSEDLNILINTVIFFITKFKKYKIEL